MGERERMETDRARVLHKVCDMRSLSVTLMKVDTFTKRDRE